MYFNWRILVRFWFKENKNILLERNYAFIYKFLPFFKVDYGDGSGISTWTRENAQDLWRHAYSQAGTFTVTTVVTGVYDKVVQTKTVFITVTETVTGHFS